MRQVIKVPAYYIPEEYIQVTALEYRGKYGEDPAFGVPHAALYGILRRLGRSMHTEVKGGGQEPLYIDLVTICGISRVFVDKACAEDEMSYEEPDA